MKKIRVLIADDSALSRALLKEYLERDTAIEVIAEASNGQEAVEMACALTPHVITMDVQMPKMDGLAAIEAIMTRRAIPILVVSSVADAKT
ncbi:MAG TPA: response regulator, partial [Thiotrichales bacterium]|nr:response regulator [Thiotrichales bacterium]